MNAKYLSRDERTSIKRKARQERKAIFHSLSKKEAKEWKRSGKGLRDYAETVGKNRAKDWYAPTPKADAPS